MAPEFRDGFRRLGLPLSEDGYMKIALEKDVEEFLEQQVRAGVAANATELANAVLRSVREQQQKPFEVTPELEAWLLEAADQPSTPLSSADFDAIRERTRRHTQAAKT
jgi:Arc/MetJ-type ribon-helix-helix transcriptional regulator